MGMMIFRDLFSQIFFDGDGAPAGTADTPAGNAPAEPEKPATPAEPAEPAAGGKPPAAEPGKSGEGDPPKLAKFASQFSPEIREKYKDELSGDYAEKHLNDVWTELMETKGKMKRAIIVPDPENPDPDELKTFMKQLGIPESPDGYELKAEGVDQKVLDKFAGEALKMGLTKGQAKKVVKSFTGLVQEGLGEIKGKMKTAEQTFPARMTKELGTEKDANEAVNLAKKFLIRFGDKGTIKTVAESGLLYNTKFMAKAAEFEKSLGDEKFIDGKGPGGSGAGGKKSEKGAMGSYSADWVKLNG